MNRDASLVAAVGVLLICIAAAFSGAVAAADDAEVGASIQDTAGASIQDTNETAQVTNETADAVDDERPVTLNGEEERDLTIAEAPGELIDLTVTVDDTNVSIRNPSDVDVAVTVTDETGEEGAVRVEAGETVAGDLDRGSYVLTAEAAAAERTVTLNGERELALTSSKDVRTLFVSVDNRTVTFFNPNDEHVSVTVSSNGDHVLTFTAHPGGERSWEFETGIYTLSAATSQDNETVPVNYEAETNVLVNPDAVNVDVTVDDRNVSIANPSDEDAAVTVTDETGAEQTVAVPAGGNVSGELAPGNYTLFGGADGHPVLLNGQQHLAVNIVEEPPEPIDLDVIVRDQIVILDNPADTDVTVTATDEAGEERTIHVPSGETAVEAFAPGNYTLTAEPTANDA